MNDALRVVGGCIGGDLEHGDLPCHWCIAGNIALCRFTISLATGNSTELECIWFAGELAHHLCEQLLSFVVLAKCEVPEHRAQVERFFQLGVIVASAEKRLDEAHHLRGRTLAAILGRIELDRVVEDTHWQIATPEASNGRPR